MEKLKSIIFVAGIMLLILAAAGGYLSIRYLSAILPADSYEDKGVYVLLYVAAWCVIGGMKRRMG